MKTVYVADKSTYGTEFFSECNSLDELKRAIVEHELRFKDKSYTPDKYTEKLFKEHSEGYTLYQVELHDSEFIRWEEYDGKSYFEVLKKEPNILSIVKSIEYLEALEKLARKGV